MSGPPGAGRPDRVDGPVDAWVESVVEQLLRRHDRVWWLDGAAGRAWSGRVSLLGWLHDDEPSLTYDAARRLVVEHRGDAATAVGDDLFEVLRGRIGAAGSGSRWYGWAGYASRSDLSARVDTSAAAPDGCWMPALRWIEVDHDSGEVRRFPVDLRVDVPASSAVALARPAGFRVEADWTLDRYTVAFDTVQEALRAGDTYEVNLTYRHRVTGPAGVQQAWAAYRRLRRLSTAPYAGFLHHRGASLLAASPERFAAVHDGIVDTRPVKGTVARSADPVEDRRRVQQLADQPRTRAENLIVCDLLRNDVATVSRPGSVQVPELLAVETYPGLHQLVSTVRGRLADGVTAVDVLRALLPGGSMTGAPKLRTMQVIAGVEDSPRGIYSGAFGWLEPHAADLGMVIRSWVHVGRSWTAGTGGGVTVLSDAESEYAETRLKLDRLRTALGRAG